ncbi:hypothetical protein CTI12_AA258550 [Artemisia annua]|uniref:Uncharacterized protein n=1 Tax=Artemisia annua TaxID=35608 RepID=A0A2U1NJP3_ARTAN|nr:hypothetical protein CTI12_AA258550 [Artemisia annua]
MIIPFWSRCDRMYVCVIGVEQSNITSQFFVGVHSLLVCGSAVCVEIHHATSDENYNLLAIAIGLFYQTGAHSLEETFGGFGEVTEDGSGEKLSRANKGRRRKTTETELWLLHHFSANMQL